LCTGCRLCIEACPLGVMQFDENRGLASKCDLCVDRIDGKLKPACVNACPSHCIYFGDINKVIDKAPNKNLLARYKSISS
jgi:Fe-S-cluster-containing dehydrogenase component